MATVSHVVSGLSVGNHTISVLAYNPINRGYDSPESSVSIIAEALSNPSVSWTPSSVVPDSGKATWDAVKFADKYEVYLDGVLEGSTSNKEFTLSSISLGDHTVGVKACFTPDEEYDSSLGVVQITTTKLSTPYISGHDSTYVAYTDPEKTKRYQIYRYNDDGTVATGYPKDPQCKLILFSPISKAGNYRLKDGTSTVISSISKSAINITLTNPQWQYTDSTPSLACTQGSHSYTLMATYEANEDYNSDPSNAIEVTIDTLPVPVLSWKNSDSNQSFVSVSISGDQASDVDFYEIQLGARYGVLGAGPYYGSFDKASSGESTEFNLYSLASGNNLLSTDTKINTDDYTVTAACNSYNNFYHLNKSASSNKLQYYSVYQLASPKDVSYNISNETISFTGDSKASKYVINIYTGSTTNPVLSSSVETTTPTSTKLSLGAGFWIIRIVAKSGSTNSSNPYIVDSLESDPVAVGTLDTPVITRTGKYLDWDSIQNANTYIIYDGTAKIAEVAATSDASMRYNMQNIGVGSHSIKVVATATIDEVKYLSPDSNTITFTVVRISAPSISFNPTGTSVVVWNSVDYANNYDFYINDTLDATLSSSTLSRTVSKDAAGKYTIRIIAKNNDDFLYRTSNSSNSIEYNVIKMGVPTNVAYNKSSNTVTWEAPSNAISTTRYMVYVNGILATTTAELSFDTSSYTAGSYGVYIVSKDSGTADSPNPKYLNSDNSTTVTFGKLTTPVISVSDNTISWPAIENADYYDVYNYSDVILETPDNRYVVASADPASFYISVIARSNSSNMAESDRSNYISYTISKLAAPVISINSETLVLSWNSIQNANYYQVWINGELRITTSNVNAALKDYLPQGSRSTIFVFAASNYSRYLTSDRSNIIYQFIQSSSVYLVKVGDSTYGVNLPFSINTTMDETLDTASVTTVPLTNKDPFEAYTSCSILITDGASNPTTLINNIRTRPYNFILDSDTVEEVQVGSQSRYKHHLSLIEPTKILETYILPNFSITQKLSVVISEYSRRSDGSISYSSSYKDSSGNTVSLMPWNSTMKSKTSKEVVVDRWAEYSGNFNDLDKLNASIPESAITGYIITLPMDSRSASTWFYSDSKKYMAVFGIHDTDYTNYFDGSVQGYNKPAMHWYIRNNDIGANESYEDYCTRKYAETISSSNGYTEIYSTTDYQTLKKYSFAKAGTYDLIYTIDGVKPQSSFGVGSDYDNRKLEGMCTSQPEILTWPNSNLTESLRAEIDKLKPYRVEWNEIKIIEKPTEAMLTRESISITDALKKVLDVVNNQYYTDNSSKLSAPKFTLDESLFKNSDGSDKYSNISCPEMTFEKGKSLWDALLEIGRLFGGIPRLLEGNKISFDILKDMAYPINRDPGLSPDGSELEDMESQITNHTTGYISQISNMIPDGSISIFPGPKLWVTPRSQSDSDPYVTRSNMSIVMDKKIFKVFDMKITNFNSDNSSEELSLLPYVYEKSLFDTLNNDAQGKGLAMYWKKGDNKIYGLGIIPQASEMYSAFGWSSDMYVIQHILSNLGYTHLNDVNSFKYRVWFIPYVDGRVITEQSNLYGLHNNSYLNLNQENNTISDSTFGKSAQTQVSRLGNNSIKKTMRLYDYYSIPSLAAVKVYGNEKYYIDNLLIEFGNEHYDVTANFSKNWNKINDRVGINSEYRQYEIYGSDWVNRSINLNNYCYVSTSDYGTSLSRAPITVVNDIKDALSGNPYTQLPYFYVTSLSTSSSGTLERTQYHTYNIESNKLTSYLENSPGMLLPAAYNTLGNSIMYSCGMKDNFSAGVNATTEYNQKFVQRDVRYVDDFGKCTAVFLTLCDPTENQLSTYLNTDGQKFPAADYRADGSSLNHYLFSNQYYINKDNRECLNFAYQLHFLTFDRHLTIHEGLTKYLYKANIDSASTSSFNWNIGHIIYVGYQGSCKDITMISYNTGSILASSVSPVIQNGHITIPAVASTGNSSIIGGYALVWSTTGQILYNYDFDAPQAASSIPAMYFNFSSDKLAYHDN